MTTYRIGYERHSDGSVTSVAAEATTYEAVYAEAKELAKGRDLKQVWFRTMRPGVGLGDPRYVKQCTCDTDRRGRIKSGADTSRCPNPDHRRLALEEE